MKDEPCAIKQITAEEVGLMHQLLDCFAIAFEEEATYCDMRPNDDYLQNLLSGDTFIALVAQEKEKVIGGLAAYELKKFEQPRSEVYIYDLAVAKTYRRRGIATALIKKVVEIAAARNAWVVFVQADYGDDAATGLYDSLGAREEVLHFDIPVKKAQ